jgi:hypothetical protein
MKNERENYQSAPAVTGCVTTETQVKDIVSSGLLEDIRTMQAIHSRLEDYKKKKDAEVGTWDTFSVAAVMAMNHLCDAMSEMSSLAGSELDFAILNR